MLAEGPLAENLTELAARRLTSAEVMALVRERHPKQAHLDDKELFEHTYVETHGPSMCELTRERLKTEFHLFCNGGTLTLYFVRCLLPNYRGSA